MWRGKPAGVHRLFERLYVKWRCILFRLENRLGPFFLNARNLAISFRFARTTGEIIFLFQTRKKARSILDENLAFETRVFYTPYDAYDRPEMQEFLELLNCLFAAMDSNKRGLIN